MKTGIKKNLSNDEYHQGEGISKSGLDLIAQSPLHYWAKYLDPNRESQEPTPALLLGTAIHTSVLEPERFATGYRVAPKVDRRTKDGKAAWEGFQAECAANNATPISFDDYEICRRIADQVRSHPTAQTLFAKGAAEQSAFWVDDETGVLCKCRPDWLTSQMIVDLKSARDASPGAFQRAAWSYRYHVQAAWYLDGVAAATGKPRDAFIFAAFEKEPPFACAFYYADETMIEAGRQEYRRLLRVYADCLNSGRWPGYPIELQALTLPAWAAFAANDNEPQQGE
jgi:hypothetical protein